MCGICGCAGGNDKPRRVAAMLERLAHRGPDDEGLWQNDSVALGHKRLAIVDLSKDGHQPMSTPDGVLTAVVNGEIYNYPDLRASLEAQGASFQSHSDSEVVLHAYRAEGVASFRKLNGMFAYGLWDDAAKKLFVVRDRLGIKPVYYWHDSASGTFHFASEIKAILAASGRSRWSIDAQGLGQYLTYQNTLGDCTLFAEIKIVPPGHYLEYSGGKIRVEPYWRPELPQTASTSFPDAVAAFQSAFSHAVDRHLMSDVPVACYLSSGIDSSMVSAEAARHLKQPPLTFTGRFLDGPWYDESSGAEDIAKHVGIPLRKIDISASDFETHFDDVIRALDEPRMGIGAFSQYMVAKAASRERKVILTGHGGDELFSGYPVFKLAMLMDGGVRGSSLRSLRLSELPHLAYFWMKQMQRRPDGGVLPVLFNEREQSRVLRTSAAAAVASSRKTAWFDEIGESASSMYQRILLTYLRVYLPGLLVVEDKISMAHALEARTPFLNNEMVALSLGISEATKLHGGVLKAIVKQAARSMLPVSIFKMPKRGFPTPLSIWLRGPLSEWLRERLCGPESRLTRIFAADYAQQAVGSYLRSWRRYVRPLDEIATHRMWMLLCLESWLRQTEEYYGISLSIEG